MILKHKEFSRPVRSVLLRFQSGGVKAGRVGSFEINAMSERILLIQIAAESCTELHVVVCSRSEI